MAVSHYCFHLPERNCYFTLQINLKESYEMVKKIFRVSIISLLLLTGLIAQEYPAADSLIESYRIAGETVGLAVTVSRNNEIIYSKGFGYGNLEQQTPVYPSKTRFRIGSISKPLSTVGLGILIAEGRINLDAPVQKYVPEFPEKQSVITARMLAGHLSGIRHYRNQEFLSALHYTNVFDPLDVFAADSLECDPMSQFCYTSYGYTLLSAVMERAAGEEFLSFIRQRVTEPLGMIHTVADLKDTIISYRSGFYALDSGIVINAPYVDCSNKWAGGGYLSTSEDIVRMGNAMLYAELFPQSIVDTLLTSMQTDSGKVTGYGMGWSVDTDENGTFSFGHAGGSVGGSCRLIVYPDEKLVIAVLTNDSRTPIVRDLDKIAAVFLKN